MRESGRTIGGRYRVDRELWSAPHAQTLLVTDLRNGRPCVLRLLFTARAPAGAVQRFEAQSAILAKFDHAGLPRFFDGFVEGEGEARARVIVSSYHPGESLERLQEKGRPLTESQALALMRRIVPVLEYLHAFDPPVVHRFIKATGIVIGPDSRPCLTDIEFAVPGIDAPPAGQDPPGSDELARAAPEVFVDKVAPASDIYALGLAVVRGMTTQDPVALLRDGAKTRLRSALGVSEAFAAVIAKMLDPSLERRYADAQSLGADLARLAGEPGPAARTAPKAAAAQPPVREAEEPKPGRSAKPLAFALLTLALLALAALVVVLRRPPAPGTSQLAPSARSVAPSAPAAPPASPPPDMTAGPSAPPTSEASPTVPGGHEVSASPAVAPASAPQGPGETVSPPAPPPGAPAPAPGPAAAAGDVAPPAPAPAAAPVPSAPALPAGAAARLEGRLYFDGKLFADAAAPAPIFWFRNDQTQTDAKPQVDYSAGEFTVLGLPAGRYRMSVRIDLNPENPNLYPGDLYASSSFTLGPEKTGVLEIPLRRVVRLLQPVDNGAVIPGWDSACGAGIRIPAQSVFAWESLDPEASYDLSIDRYVCRGGTAPVGTAVRRFTTDSWMKVDLPPSREGEYYSLKLGARKGGRPIGTLTTHGRTGVIWELRFTVPGGAPPQANP